MDEEKSDERVYQKAGKRILVSACCYPALSDEERENNKITVRKYGERLFLP